MLPVMNQMRDVRIWLIVAVFLVLAGMSISTTFLYTPDSARYLIWANSLAEFKGFIDAAGPEPERYVVHAPLYALLLAPLMLFFPGAVIGAKIATLVLGTVMLLFFYRWVKGGTNAGVAAAATLALALNPLMILYSTEILSEVAFGIALIGVFVISEKLLEPGRGGRKEVWGLAAALTAAVFVREVGMTLVITTLLFLSLRREYGRAVIVLALTLAAYTAWYVRNEVVVAGVENPPLQNVKFMAGHWYTVSETPFVQELWARITSNLSVYKDLAGKIFFLAQYHERRYDAIVMTDFPLSFFADLPGILVFVFAAIPLVLAHVGFLHVLRTERRPDMPLLFILVYLVIMLLYPINDIRFLFPVLLVLLYYAALGWFFVMQYLRGRTRAHAIAGAGGSVAFVLLLIPHLWWDVHYASQATSYRSSPEEYAREVRRQRSYPEMFMKPLEPLGDWLRRNTDTSAVIGSYWREIAFTAGGRKVVGVSTLLPVDFLENLIRDYGVSYLVVHVEKTGIRELEAQMRLAVRCRYETVFRAGSMEILRVSHRLRSVAGEPFRAGLVPGEPDGIEPLRPEQEEIRGLFGTALGFLVSDQPDSARTLFQEMLDRGVRSPIVAFYDGIAGEFSGRYEEAQRRFQWVRSVPQAGSLLLHAGYHLSLLKMLRDASALDMGEIRASALTKLSFNYWDLGFRNQARRRLEEALRESPDFPPALVFGIFYASEAGDRASAHALLKRLQRAEPFHVAIPAFRVIVRYSDSLSNSRDGAAKVRALAEIAEAYAALGMWDAALERLKSIVASDPDHVQAWRRAAEIHERRNRVGPALQSWEKARELDPADPEAAGTVERLRKRFP